MEQLAPIAYFTYNRPEHTKISLEALKKNELSEKSEILIFSDGAKNNDLDKKKVNEVRNIIKNFKGFKKKKIIFKKKKYGLYKNFVEGITEVCEIYKKVIVVEDDNKASKYFLNFINDGLNLYEKDNLVCSINGWFYPKKNHLQETFFLLGGNTWGWGTWKRAWNEFNPDTNYLLNEIKKKKLIKKFNLNNSFDYYKMLQKRHDNMNDSHTIIWKASTFLNEMYSLYPAKSLINNIGFDGSGTHNKNSDDTYEHNFLVENKITLERVAIEENKKALTFIKNFYRIEKILYYYKLIKKKFLFFFNIRKVF